MKHLICACCQQPVVRGLTRTESAIVEKMGAHPEGLSSVDILLGLAIDVASFPVTMQKLKKKLRKAGFEVYQTNLNGGRGHKANYSIQSIAGKN